MKEKGEGVPRCSGDGKLCDVTMCRWWISSLEFGNCAARVDRRMSLAEVGVALGITRERVRQIEKRAIQRIRKTAEGAELLRILRSG